MVSDSIEVKREGGAIIRTSYHYADQVVGILPGESGFGEVLPRDRVTKRVNGVWMFSHFQSSNKSIGAQIGSTSCLS
jgi:hypothetical protein